MKLDKHITRNIDLHDLIALNHSRSYRDGNLMHLNYIIIDKACEPIFSIEFDCDRYVSKEDIMNIICAYQFGKKDLSYKLFVHASNRDWFPRLDVMALSKKLDKPNIAKDFINYIGLELFRQISRDVEELDFFSLQTKEEYNVHAKKIDELMADTKGLLLQKVREKKFEDFSRLINTMCEEHVPLNEYWDEYLNYELNNVQCLCWILELQLELVLNISNEDPELFEQMGPELEKLADMYIEPLKTKDELVH